MRVFCPRCNTGYEIDDELLKLKSRRMRCGNCGEIFTVDKIVEEDSNENAFDMLQEAMGAQSQEDKNSPVGDNQPSIVQKDVKADTFAGEHSTPDDTKQNESSTAESVKAENSTTESAESKNSETENAAAENSETENEEFDIEDIFERLSERTENLINEERKLPFCKRMLLWIRNILGLSFRINWKYVGIAAVLFGCVWLFNNRYDIVRKAPFMNGIYKSFGIDAKIAGEGLEFQNISWDMLAEGENTRLDIRGFIFNQTEKNIEIPLIHVEIMDKETELLQTQNRTLESSIVRAGEKVPLLISVPNPAPTLKYVYITFMDVD